MSETTIERSQADVIGAPPSETWDQLEKSCESTFGGGYRTEDDMAIFAHGMSTVFNLLRTEFPPMKLCKASPALIAALETLVEGVEYTNALSGTRGRDAVRAAYAVIAKAQGGAA